MTPLILIAEDDADIRGLLKLYLDGEGLRVLEAADGTDALALAREHTPDMAILDIMMPGMNGFELTRALRKYSDIPILILSAKSQDNDKILGLNIGADDYVTKPFNPLEVVARVKAQLRQYMRYKQPCIKQEAERTEYDIRGMTISKSSHKCILFGKEIQLTPTEFSILWYLCERQGTVVSTEELFEAVWGERYFDSNNTVMAHIGRLREKMKEPSRNPKFIKTVWGVGYTIEK